MFELAISFLFKKILTHPQIVHNLYCLLEFYRDVYRKVLVETWTHWKILRKRWPVIFSTCKSEKKKSLKKVLKKKKEPYNTAFTSV